MVGLELSGLDPSISESTSSISLCSFSTTPNKHPTLKRLIGLFPFKRSSLEGNQLVAA